MPDPLCAFVGQGAALTAAAWAAAAANADGGGPFQRLGEGRGAALREAWTVEAVRTVPAERRAAAGDADELFAYARPPTINQGGYPFAALGSEDWCDAIHAGVVSDGRPSVHGVAPSPTAPASSRVSRE